MFNKISKFILYIEFITLFLLIAFFIGFSFGENSVRNGDNNSNFLNSNLVYLQKLKFKEYSIRYNDSLLLSNLYNRPLPSKKSINLKIDEVSNIDTDTLSNALRYNLKELAPYFIEAEKRYEVNAIFLSAITSQESDYGRSLLSNTNNNLFGYTDNQSPNGFRYFSSKEECIYFVAKNIRKYYLTPNAVHYNGSSVDGVAVKWVNNSEHWKKSVKYIMNEIYNKAI